MQAAISRQVALKELLTIDIFRDAQNRYRPATDVRQHVIGDRLIILHQVELLFACRGEDNAIGMRHRYAADVDAVLALPRGLWGLFGTLGHFGLRRRRFDLGFCVLLRLRHRHFLIAVDVLGQLIFAQPLE